MDSVIVSIEEYVRLSRIIIATTKTKRVLRLLSEIVRVVYKVPNLSRYRTEFDVDNRAISGAGVAGRGGLGPYMHLDIEIGTFTDTHDRSRYLFHRVLPPSPPSPRERPTRLSRELAPWK